METVYINFSDINLYLKGNQMSR